MSRNKKEVVGTKYFLILFARFGKNKKLLNDILCQFETVLSSNFLKYQEGDDFIITHFETEEPLKNLKEFCGYVLDNTVENYILFPNNKNVTLSLPDDMKEHLLDLETDGLNIQSKNTDFDINFNDDEDDDEEDDILSEIQRKNNKKPPLEQLLKTVFDSSVEEEMSLDELLDKVQKKGLKSLTKKEKELLYGYSKRI
jgi:hypothetical protein